MQHFEDYKKRIEEKMGESRGALLQLMAENLLCIRDISNEVGVDWVTMHRFLVQGLPIQIKTMVKVEKYLSK